MSIFAKLTEGILTHSPEEMRAIAAQVAAILPENTTIELSGDLGAGKTVFVKGLAEAWGIEETVTSPSFTIFSLYRGKRNLLHLDAYRLNSADEIEPLMIEEFLQPPYCLAVEWPEKIKEWLPPDSWKLTFSIQEEGGHAVRLLTQPTA
jgi:tRNA threonylcarbamoyladenosine biosynthesis protein TsaE